MDGNDVLGLFAHCRDDPAGGLQIVEDDLLGNLVHAHDVFALHIDTAGGAEVSLQCAGQIVLLDMLGRAGDRVHQDQEVVCAIVPFLMMEEESWRRFLQSGS